MARHTISLAERIARLTAQGFTATPTDSGRYLRVRCSQCDALVINNVATHERGCPNRPRHQCDCADCVDARERGCQCCACRSEEVETDV